MTAMRRTTSGWAGLALMFIGLGGPCVWGQAARGLGVVRGDSEVTVTLNGKVFTTYRYGADLKYPFFYPVMGPVSGKTVTTYREQPWPHHSSLFFGCDHVNGMNFWQPADNLATGQILARGVDVVETGAVRVVLTSVSDWAKPGGAPVMRDRRRMVITAPSDALRFIDFDITLEPLVDIQIKKNNHSLFAVRMARDLSVDGGGKMVNADGQSGEQDTFGKPSAWMAGYGERGGGVEGLAIFPHPDNRWHPAPWFTRNYGNFSPTPIHFLKEGQMRLPAGESFTLRYRVVVFAGAPESADLKGLYEQYAR